MMLENARLTAAAPGSPEQADEAARQVHRAMYEFALGAITADERRQILTILHPSCPDMFFSSPDVEKLAVADQQASLFLAEDSEDL